MTSQTLLRRLVGMSRARATTTTFSRIFSTAPAFVEHESESFLTGTSSLYAEQMFENYQADPNSVHESWRTYFDNLQEGVPYEESLFNSPTAVPPPKAAARQRAAVAVSEV